MSGLPNSIIFIVSKMINDIRKFCIKICKKIRVTIFVEGRKHILVLSFITGKGFSLIRKEFWEKIVENQVLVPPLKG